MLIIIDRNEFYLFTPALIDGCKNQCFLGKIGKLKKKKKDGCT